MSEATLTSGAAQVEITPPLGVEMTGYGPYVKRQALSVLDPLHARAIWIETPQQRIALLSADLCLLDARMHAEVAALLAPLGLEREHLLIACTHTHSGPATVPLLAWGVQDPGYMAQLPGLLARAVTEARAQARPARIGATTVRIDGVGFNREQLKGPIDQAAQLLRIESPEQTPIALAYNFGAHPVVRHPFTTRISGDWTGMVSGVLRHTLGAPALAFNGCLGNLNAHHMTWGLDDIEDKQRLADMRVGDMSMRFIQQIEPALRQLETSPTAEIRTAWKMLELPCEPQETREQLQQIIDQDLALADSMRMEDLPPMHERYEGRETETQLKWRDARYRVDRARKSLALMDDPRARVVRTPLQVIRINDMALVAWGGEPFVELGIELRQRSPIRNTFVIGCANDSVGYLPTPWAYESQGRPNQHGFYPCTTVPVLVGQLPFRKDVGRILVDKTLEALEEVR